MLIEELFDNFKKEAFRLELLNFYNVEGEWDIFQQFKKGRTVNFPENDKFCDEISNLVQQGKNIIRLHVLPEKLTDYLKFEIKIGYPPQIKAGAKIYIVEQADYEKLISPATAINDFWAFDNEKILEFIYDDQGHFLQEKLISKRSKVKQLLLLKNKLLKIALPLTNEFLKTHNKKC